MVAIVLDAADGRAVAGQPDEPSTPSTCVDCAAHEPFSEDSSRTSRPHPPLSTPATEQALSGMPIMEKLERRVDLLGDSMHSKMPLTHFSLLSYLSLSFSC